MGKDIVIIIGLILILFSVINIYDARQIALRHFSTGETNSATTSLKVIGTVISIIALTMIYILK